MLRGDASRAGARGGGALRIGWAWLALVMLVGPMVAAALEPTAGRIELFTRPGCPHCERAKAFLAELAARRPGLEIVEHDVVADPAAGAVLERRAREAGIHPPGVPAFGIGGAFVVGFDEAETTGRQLEALLDAPAVTGPAAPAPGAPRAPPADIVRVPLLGGVRASSVGLPLFTLAVGLLDGFNPCAMWALLFLLSLLVRLCSRKRMLAVGGVFVLVGGLWYYALLAAWLNVFLWIGLARGVQIVLAWAAVAIGAIHLKDALAPSRGPSLAIPERAKPGVYARVRRILYAESLGGALCAVVVLAVLVNSVELLCTAGLPALYTHVLSLQALSPAAHYAYLGLYVAAYLLDDAALLALAVATLGSRKLQAHEGRWLNGIAGMLIVALGLVLLLRPGWLAA